MEYLYSCNEVFVRYNFINYTGFNEGKKNLKGKAKKNSGQGGLVEIDGFDISKIPEHLNVQDSVWAGNNQTKPTLLKIGDITVPELRRRLMLKRQQVLNKNKYYVQQKVKFFTVVAFDARLV